MLSLGGFAAVAGFTALFLMEGVPLMQRDVLQVCVCFLPSSPYLTLPYITLPYLTFPTLPDLTLPNPNPSLLAIAQNTKIKLIRKLENKADA